MEVHPRTFKLQEAESRLGSFVFDLAEELNLSPSERFLLLSNELRSLSIRCVRSEREDESQEQSQGSEVKGTSEGPTGDEQANAFK